MRKLRNLLATAIILSAVLPSLAISYFLLQKLLDAATEAVHTELDRTLSSTVNDINYKFEVFSNNFQLFARERFLTQALSNFLFSGQAFKAMKDFTDQTPAVASTYLLNEDLQVVEEYRGSISALESSTIIRALSEAISSEEIRDGRQWLLAFEDKEVLRRATKHLNRPADAPSSSFGVAIVTPLYQHVLQEGLTRSPDGYLLAILPIVTLYDTVVSSLQHQEGAEILWGERVVVGEKEDIHTSQSNELMIAVKSFELKGNLSDNALPFSLFVHVLRESRMAPVNKAQSTLTAGIIGAIVISSLLALLLIRTLSEPFKKLTMILRQYQEGDYTMPVTEFRYAEFEQVQQLIGDMGNTIKRQLESLQSKNEELQRVGALKDDYLNKLRELNEQLEQRVAEQTRELRQNLSQTEQSNQIFQSLLKLTIDLQHSEDNQDLTHKTLVQLSRTFPDSALAMILFKTRSYEECFLTEGMSASQQGWIRQMIDEFLDLPDQHLPKRVDYHGKLHYLFPLSSSSRKLQGVLLVAAENMGLEHQAIVELFTKFMGAILESRLLSEDLKILARTDDLTGLPNRKAFEESFDNLRYEHERYPDRQFALFIVDANGLKNANDRFGHQVGDRMLRSLSGVLAESCRRSDAVYRLGGDEYGLLIRNGSLQACKLMLERLMHHNNKISLPVTNEEGEHQLVISFSVGFASTEEYPPSRLFKIADERMYQDKSNYYKQKSKLEQSHQGE